MSFDNPSSFAQWQSSLASGSENTSQGRAARPPQSVWGQPTSNAGTRGGLTPLATSNINLTSNPTIRRPTSSTSPAPPNTATSPGSVNFPSLLSSTRAAASRQPSSASSTSSFPPLQTGGQQQSFTSNQSVTSPRSRTITPLSQLVGSTSNTAQSQAASGGGGGGGAGGARSGTYSPSPSGQNISSSTNLTGERSLNAPLSAGIGGPGQASLTKITVAQVLLLLDTISEKEGKAKWDSKAEQIRKVSVVVGLSLGLY